MAWTSPRTWAAAETVTAAIMNAHVRDNLKAMSEWTAYTPTWAATGGTPTLGNGTLEGNYAKYGNMLLLRIQLTIGSTTSMGTTTAWTFTLPAGVTATDLFCINGRVLNAGSAAYPCMSTPTAPVGLWGPGGARVGYNSPFTFGDADTLSIAGVIPV